MLPKADKVYSARIVPAGANVYDVVVQWGRRGSTLSQGKKAVKVSLEKAQTTLERLAYRMQVYDGGKPFDVGKVFSGTTNETRALIDAALGEGRRLVAEVRYLDATDDAQLFQPIFVRVREDKLEKECLRAQLKSTNRDVSALDDR